MNDQYYLPDNRTADQRLTAAVRSWAIDKEISPAEFARQLGYSYNHAYQMLKGDGAASVETIGRIAINLGTSEVADILARMKIAPTSVERSSDSE